MSDETVSGHAARIVADLRAAIACGDLRPGDRIPSERDLAARYHVARGTAQRARAELTRDGLAVNRPRSGMYVRDFPHIERVTPDRLRRDRWQSGISIQAADLGPRELLVDAAVATGVPATSDIATALGLAEGSPVVERARRYSVDGRLVQTAVSYIPADIAAGTLIEADDPGAGGIFARLTEAGHAPVSGVEYVRARMPTPVTTANLELPPGTPVHHIERRVHTATGRTVEVNYMTLDATVYVLVYKFSLDATSIE